VSHPCLPAVFLDAMPHLSFGIGSSAPNPVGWVLLAVLGYLLGSIPFGILITKAFAGKDVRTVGSGNIGATNVVRAAGRTAGILTLILDALKGALPTYVAWTVVGVPGAALTGYCAFLGHVFPIALRFKGGKGVATALGVLVVVAPWSALAALVVYGLLLATTRVSAIGSMGAVAAVLVTVCAVPYSPPVIALAVALAVVIVWRHRENLAKLLGSKTS
jgi:glycerol-3-phosphate acyltransferase PlsY